MVMPSYAPDKWFSNVVWNIKSAIADGLLDDFKLNMEIARGYIKRLRGEFQFQEDPEGEWKTITKKEAKKMLGRLWLKGHAGIIDNAASRISSASSLEEIKKLVKSARDSAKELVNIRWWKKATGWKKDAKRYLEKKNRLLDITELEGCAALADRSLGRAEELARKGEVRHAIYVHIDEAHKAADEVLEIARKKMGNRESINKAKEGIGKVGGRTKEIWEICDRIAMEKQMEFINSAYKSKSRIRLPATRSKSNRLGQVGPVK